MGGAPVMPIFRQNNAVWESPQAMSLVKAPGKRDHTRTGPWGPRSKVSEAGKSRCLDTNCS